MYTLNLAKKLTKTLSLGLAIAGVTHNALAAGFNPQAYFPNSSTGIYAYNLATNEEILSVNSDQMLKPASTLKILTALKAASTFPKDFSFVTRAYANSRPQNGTINGDLVVVFDGDPTFNTSSLDSLANNIANAGISRITGKLIINTGKYAGHDRPIGWNWSNNSMCFSSENSAASYNNNCIQGNLKTNGSVGSIAGITTTNGNAIDVQSNVRIVPSNQGDSCEVNYVFINAGRFDLEGCNGQTKQPLWMNFAVPNGNNFTANALANKLASLGISFNGYSIDSSPYTGGLTEVAQQASSPIGSLIQVMLHKSENHIAEHLYRGLAYHNLRMPINYSLAKDVNDQVMASFGFNFAMNVVDGSGLSYYDSITPRGLTQVMGYIYNHDQEYNLINKFPRANQGTLAGHKGLQGFDVYGKTGSFYETHNFVGIVTNKAGQPVAFSYIINNNPNKGAKATLVGFERDLLNYLVNNY